MPDNFSLDAQHIGGDPFQYLVDPEEKPVRLHPHRRRLQIINDRAQLRGNAAWQGSTKAPPAPARLLRRATQNGETWAWPGSLSFRPLPFFNRYRDAHAVHLHQDDMNGTAPPAAPAAARPRAGQKTGSGYAPPPGPRRAGTPARTAHHRDSPRHVSADVQGKEGALVKGQGVAGVARETAPAETSPCR